MLVAIRSMIGELVRHSHTVLLRSPLCSVVRALRGLLSTLPATRRGFVEVPRSSGFVERWASFENLGKWEEGLRDAPFTSPDTLRLM